MQLLRQSSSSLEQTVWFYTSDGIIAADETYVNFVQLLAVLVTKNLEKTRHMYNKMLG